MVRTVNIDFDAVRCEPSHMTVSGKGWARRLRELGGSDDEAQELRRRLLIGMAAEIELQRIYHLAGLRRSR